MRRILALGLAMSLLVMCGPAQSVAVVNGSAVDLTIGIWAPDGTGKLYAVPAGGSSPAHGGDKGYWTIKVIVTEQWVKQLTEASIELDHSIGATSSSAIEGQRYVRSGQMRNIAEAMRGRGGLGFACGRRVAEKQDLTVTVTVVPGAGFACN